MSYDLEILG